MTNTHKGHDTWPLISDIGTIWCRDCQVHFRPGEERTVEEILRPLMDTKRTMDTCPTCGGEGVVGGLVISDDMPTVDEICYRCKGKGVVPIAEAESMYINTVEPEPEAEYENIPLEKEFPELWGDDDRWGDR